MGLINFCIQILEKGPYGKNKEHNITNYSFWSAVSSLK